MFIKFLYKMYSIAKRYEQRYLNEKKKQQAILDNGTILYSCSEILNLANNPNKITIGKHSHIYGNLTIYKHVGEIKIGNYCSLGDGSRIVSGGKITIGNRVMIAHNVNILDNNSHPVDAKLRHEDFVNAYTIGMQEYNLKAKEIVIEDDVWIGFNCIILKGVKIGRGAIIGAGSIVTKDIEPWTINIGNPAKQIKKLEPILEI